MRAQMKLHFVTHVKDPFEKFREITDAVLCTTSI